MKILYIINSLDSGGAAFPVPDLVSVMRNAGHEVLVASLMERNGRARPRLDAEEIPYRVLGGEKRRLWQSAVRLRKLIKQYQPDWLWTSLTHATIYGQLLGKLHDIPVISWQHNAWLKPINQKILQKTVPLTRYWVTDSQEVFDFSVQQLGVSPEKISIWPLIIANPQAPEVMAWRSGPLKVGSLGRLHKNKGYDHLIRALARLEKLHPGSQEQLQVCIGGEGERLQELQQLADSLQVRNIEFAGFLDNPENFLQQQHGYIQPSHHEGLCIAGHQAMAAGLPVIASPVGQLQHSIRDSHGGMLVDYGDVDGLANALGQWLAQAESLHAIGQQARRWVLEHYSATQFEQRGRGVMQNAGIQ